MGRSSKRGAAASSTVEQEMREQEVLRANRELAAYFKGRRTEREARAALKIIRGFVRQRERIDPENRRPLPGAPKTAKDGASRHAETDRERGRRSPRQKRGQTATSSTTVDAPPATNDAPTRNE